MMEKSGKEGIEEYKGSRLVGDVCPGSDMRLGSYRNERPIQFCLFVTEHGHGHLSTATDKRKDFPPRQTR
jgi:hypothetical protein